MNFKSHPTTYGTWYVVWYGAPMFILLKSSSRAKFTQVLTFEFNPAWQPVNLNTLTYQTYYLRTFGSKMFTENITYSKFERKG